MREEVASRAPVVKHRRNLVLRHAVGSGWLVNGTDCPRRTQGSHSHQNVVGKFLRDGANGPEHQALRELIGTLIDD